MLMTISKLSHIYTSPLFDLNENMYDRKKRNNNEIPTAISIGEEERKIKKNGNKQKTTHA